MARRTVTATTQKGVVLLFGQRSPAAKSAAGSPVQEPSISLGGRKRLVAVYVRSCDAVAHVARA
jgi:hypothetical protein